jgi:hypothetical protein
MDKARRTLALELVVFFCSLIVVVISAAPMAGTQSQAQLLGLSVGSFGAGASLTSTIKDYRARRNRGE